MMFIKVHSKQGGREYFTNMNLATGFEASDNGAAIIRSNGGVNFVKETPAEIEALLAAARWPGSTDYTEQTG